MKQHWAIFCNNKSNKSKLMQQLLKGDLPERLSFLNSLEGGLLAKSVIEVFMEHEDRHDTKVIAKETSQPLRTMSSGEQKKALLKHLLAQSYDFIILDNPFDNLDASSQEALTETLIQRSSDTVFIQLITRKKDLLPFITHYASLQDEELLFHNSFSEIRSLFTKHHPFNGTIPAPLHKTSYENEELIRLIDVSVSFGNKTVLERINWQIKNGDFWQLIGKNGSGKTTLLSMLTGENPKGYGQNLYLFGQKKGTGETIWDIKKKIGYFTTAMTDKFKGNHSIENMLISGFNDSIGLYLKPTEAQLRITKKWLQLIGFWEIKDSLYRNLSLGQQRLLMTTRAMVKHPLLLILDEPTAGLDDASAHLLVALVNKISKESNTAILFVSHRREAGLKPNFTLELSMTSNGSVGKLS